jgi:hypothetical protein
MNQHREPETPLDFGQTGLARIQAEREFCSELSGTLLEWGDRGDNEMKSASTALLDEN